MKVKTQQAKDKQLKGFVTELAELSKKYGIIISVEPKKVKYAKVDELEYKIGDDCGCSKIYATNILYAPLKLDFEKRFNVRPKTEYGFYRDCLNYFDDSVQALEYWDLVHSLITQISKEAPEIIGRYLDTVDFHELKSLLSKDKTYLAINLPRLYANYIDRPLTSFIRNYEDYADMRGWD